VIPSEHRVAVPAHEQIVFEATADDGPPGRGRINDTRVTLRPPVATGTPPAPAPGSYISVLKGRLCDKEIEHGPRMKEERDVGLRDAAASVDIRASNGLTSGNAMNPPRAAIIPRLDG
jgi:hypothetical protein